MMIPELATVFVDLSAETDVLWNQVLLRAIKRCASFDEFCCQVRGGALLIPDETVGFVDFGTRDEGRRSREAHSQQRSVAFHNRMVRQYLGLTRPVTKFDVGLLTIPSPYNWDIYSISHLPQPLAEELVESLEREPGFLHLARVDTSSRLAVRKYWSELSFVGIVSQGHVLRVAWEDDIGPLVEAGVCDDGPDPSSADGRIVDTTVMLVPERRFVGVPLPIPPQQAPTLSEPQELPVVRDVVTRALMTMPYEITKSHPYDDGAVPARAELPDMSIDRIVDYRQVERKVVEYCLADAAKRRGFASLGLHLHGVGPYALADQLIGAVNNPWGRIRDARVMSDGTVQFSQAVAVSGPYGVIGPVEASWNIGPGRLLQLSSAYRAGLDLELSQGPLLRADLLAVDDWEVLDEELRRKAAETAEGSTQREFDVYGLVLIPLVADDRTTAFRKWARRNLEYSGARQVARVKHLAVNAAHGSVGDADVAIKTCAYVDLLRTAGIRAYPDFFAM